MDEALQVMKILVEHECEPGVDVANAMAQTWFTQAGLEDDEYKRGLTTAGKQEWLVQTRDGFIQMTAAGLAAATRDAH
jgi:hypothetical protein